MVLARHAEHACRVNTRAWGKLTGMRFVLRVAVAVPVPVLFDYLPPPGQAEVPRGSRVLVPFGRRRLVGVVVETGPLAEASSDASGHELKAIEAVLDEALIDPQTLRLLQWAVRYYGATPGTLVGLALPTAWRRAREFQVPAPAWLRVTESGRQADLRRAPAQRALRDQLLDATKSRAALLSAGARPALLARMLSAGLIAAADPPAPVALPGPKLNPAQRKAAAAILRARGTFSALLLAGVTGSGKTEVYLQAARRLLARGLQVMMLLPEIGLTPQLVRRVETRLGQRAIVYHSGLSEGERLDAWQAARTGRARVIVGTRSAVFLPLARPGLIVVDEEHDASYKQAEGMRYQGRDVAVMRARILNIPIVLGTATPSLESLFNARRGRYHTLELPSRAGNARLPRWRVVDARGQHAPGGLTPTLLEAIGQNLARGGQVLIYRNRRGYAPVLICDECGWHGDCARCSTHLTWHRADSRLICHHCGHVEPVPARCPDCGSPVLRAQGSGTEKLESLLEAHFPETRVHRVDRDRLSRRGEFEQLLDRVRAGEPCILVGTQMLAKGHHLPGISLALVLDVDQALFSADFRAIERLAQVVHQVSGRAGRGATEGRFLLNTRHPEHPIIRQLAASDYLQCAGDLLKERIAAGLPPARPLALLRAEAHLAEAARGLLTAAAAELAGSPVEVAGPLPAILLRRAGYWRYQLWLQAESRSTLGQALGRLLDWLHTNRRARTVRWQLDRDPLEL